MNQRYFDIANKTVYEILGDKNQDDVNAANSMLSKLLVENTDFKMFLLSTNKWFEYEAWIRRFKAKNSGIESYIKNNLELEETTTTKEELEKLEKI
jgi:hypothetical protein